MESGVRSQRRTETRLGDCATLRTEFVPAQGDLFHAKFQNTVSLPDVCLFHPPLACPRPGKRVPTVHLLPSSTKTRETMARFRNLKTALMYYHNDIGAYPFPRPGECIKNPTRMDEVCDMVLGMDSTTNCLIDDKVSVGNLPPTKYQRRWKGPYMDEEPEHFMRDQWGTKIRFRYSQNALYVWSAGPDRTFEALSETDSLTLLLAQEYNGDDLCLLVARVKR